MAISASVAHGKPRSRYAAGLPAVTPERIVTAARELTRVHGLENWTLRQLAAAVDASPGVIYHHVGDREAVVASVIDHVVGTLPLPDADLPWRSWFEELLAALRPALRGYPGVAHRLALHGAGVPSARRIIDRGVGVLMSAGFGERGALVYALLLNQACQFVALEDDRDVNPDVRVQAAKEFAAFRDQEEMPGLAAMGRYVHAAAGPNGTERHYEELYSFAIGVALDGIEARLGTR